MPQIIDDISQDQQIGSLSGLLRDDVLHCIKNTEGSNLRNLLTGLSVEFLRFRDLVNYFYQEFDPRVTVDFISEWEGMLGLPDDCFKETSDITVRREQIQAKLAAFAGVNTAKDYERIGAAYGLDIEVSEDTETESLPLTLPFLLTSGATTAFTIQVKFTGIAGGGFPLTLPFPLGSSKANILLCYFEKISPAHTVILPIFN